MEILVASSCAINLCCILHQFESNYLEIESIFWNCHDTRLIRDNSSYDHGKYLLNQHTQLTYLVFVTVSFKSMNFPNSRLIQDYSSYNHGKLLTTSSI